MSDGAVMIVTHEDLSGDGPMGDWSDYLGRGERSRVAVVTVWREISSDGVIRGRLFSEVGTAQLGAPVVEYAEGVEAIGDLMSRWLVHAARSTERT